MKKAIYSIIVIILSAIGAQAMAAKFDANVEKISIESSDDTGQTNGHGIGGNTGGPCVTRER